MIENLIEEAEERVEGTNLVRLTTEVMREASR